MHPTLLTALAAAILLATPVSVAHAQDQFEAALAAASSSTTSRLAVASRGSFVAQSTMQRAAAPAGAIPPRWRTLRQMPVDRAALQEDVDQGLLDPAALMAQIAGSLPLPSQAQPAGCFRQADALTFTMGENLSAAYADLAAHWHSDIRDLTDRAAVDAKPIRDRLRSFYLAQGFREYARYGQRAGFIHVARGLRIEVSDSSAAVAKTCRDLAHAIPLPTGPTFRVEYGDALGVGEHWVDDGSRATDAGQRVTHPFG